MNRLRGEAWPWRRTCVKVCGLARQEDVLLAADLGAWAIGFVFAPSPRRVEAEQAGSLIRAMRTRTSQRPFAVGVFQDGSLGEIVRTVQRASLDGVQLHGEEEVGLLAELRRRLPNHLILKALAIPAKREESPPLPHPGGSRISFEMRRKSAHSKAPALAPYVDAFLLDTLAGERSGGTGIVFNWRRAPQLALSRPYLVAGGLTPENVAQALAESRAAGIDVSSGIETAPGVKDEQRLRQLFCNLAQGTEGSPA